jgi:predicted ATP-grasp superfamily ATP-dependent carboligase
VRVFALEYATGGGVLERPWLAGFRAEGAAMLRALAADLADVPGTEVELVLDTASGEGWPLGVTLSRRLLSATAVRPAWDEAASAADAIWVIAPETDGVLAELTTWANRDGCVLLGSGPRVVELTASKRRTAELLAHHRVRTVPTCWLDDADNLTGAPHGWVVKPDDGVGAEGVRFFASLDEAYRRRCEARGATNCVIQPFVPGTPISLSLLAQRGHAWLLTCNVQDVGREGDDFIYRGGWVGAAEELRPVLEPIAATIAAALPELWGYVGVDLVAAPDGPVVLEINPRLTTSYVGLRRSIGVNPATLVLRLLDEDLASMARPLPSRSVRV